MNIQLIQKLDRLLMQSGHVWIPITKLLSVKTSAEATRIATENQMAYCQMDNVIYVTTKLLAAQETKIAKNVFRIMKDTIKYDNLLLDALIRKGETKFQVKLHPAQKEAVKMAMNNSLCIITGGPGTGKTTVLKMIDFCMRYLRDSIEIDYMAPTGKAAKRITESIGRTAYTINKHLGLGRISQEQKIVAATKKLAPIAIVDECSMLDTILAGALFEAIPQHGHLILCGDIDQLSSIGSGAVLRDLIDSGIVPVSYLIFNYRQEKENSLATNIHNIREGIPSLESGSHFHYVQADTYHKSNIQTQMIDSYLTYLKKYGMENIVCLTPYRRSGDTCSNVLNNILQAKINPKASDKPDYFVKYANGSYYLRVGDPVIQTMNHEDVVNGDVGVITAINNHSIAVQFSDGVKWYTNKDSIYELSLAYAMTICKAQGSEYKAVVTCMLPSHKQAMNRASLYTAVTRATNECTLFSTDEVLQSALSTEVSVTRITMLVEKLHILSHGLERIHGAA